MLVFLVKKNDYKIVELKCRDRLIRFYKYIFSNL
jgi:hypothetical protein